MKKKYTNILKKICIGILVTCLSFISIGYITFYFFVKSDLNYYSDKITNYISKEINREVSIETLEAKWVVTNPRFIINQFSIYNHDKSKAFNLKKVEIDLSWVSLFKLDFILDQIVIYNPTLEIQKNSETEYLVGGINVDLEDEQSKVSDWLLNQDDIIIVDGGITWIDNTRGEIPKLILSNLNFNFQTSTLLSYLDRHFFSLSFYSSEGTSKKISIGGHIDVDSIKGSEDLSGKISLKSSDVSLKAFKRWVDYPLGIEEGKGSLEANGVITEGVFTEASATFDIQDFSFSPGQKIGNDIKLNNFSGAITWNQSGDQSYVELNELDLATSNGLNLEKANAKISFNAAKEELITTSLNINRINLESMSEFLTMLFPNSAFTNKTLKSLAPKGELKKLKFSWKRSDANPIENLLIEAQLLKLKFKEYKNFPGLDNITGDLKYSNNKGYFKSVSRDVSIRKSNTFRAPLTFNQMSGELFWENSEFKIKDFIIRDEYILSNIQGSFKPLPNNNIFLNLDIDIPRLDIPALKKIYPKQLGREALGWLDTSLLKGSAEDIKIKVKGRSDDFPFVDLDEQPDPKKGLFTLTGLIKDNFIEYGAEWPEIEDFDAELSVKGSRFVMHSTKGHINKNSIVNFKAAIHPFTAESIKMNIDATFDSPTNNIITAVNESPINDYMKGVFNNIDGGGSGELKLKMVIPFDDIDNIPFNGTYEFQGSSLESKRLEAFNKKDSINPTISNLKGLVYISNDDVFIKNVEGILYGEPLNIDLKNIDEITKINIKSYIGENFIKEVLGKNFINKVSGKAKWSGEINLYKSKSELLFTSDLIGIQIKDLSILNKLESDTLSLSINKTATNSTEDKIFVQLGTNIKATINIANNPDSPRNIKNGLITINSNQKTVLPSKGIHLVANIASANEKDFDFLLSADESEIKSDSNKQHIAIDQAEILIQDLSLYGYILENANIKIRPGSAGTNIQFKSDEANGNILWDKNSNLIKARFDKLHLLENIKTEEEEEEEGRLIFYNPPKIDIKVQSFKSQTSNIGIVEGQMRLVATKEERIWNIELFELMNKNNILKMSGSWDDEGLNPNSSINFDWNLINLDKTLEQLEMDSLIKGGSAKIKGYLSWPGNPLNFDKTITDGRFSLDAKEGIILQVKPGVGRLFGLLTLQNLPRRLQLDFSDLFSEGFVFDEINGSVKINNGELNSDNFEIDGPAADILIKGTVNIINETQELFVTVTPRISDSMSLIALVGGPVAGAAAFIAQKILDDPLNEVLTDQYKIIGTWSEPIEEEVEQDNFLGNIIDEQIINPTRELFD